MSCVSLYIGSLSGKGGEVNTHIYKPKMWRKKMNIRTPAACCHKHRSNNEVKWKTLMNTSTLPRSPTSLYIPVAGSKYTTVWWNKHSRAHTHTDTVRESPESWDWIKSFSLLSHLLFMVSCPQKEKRAGTVSPSALRNGPASLTVLGTETQISHFLQSDSARLPLLC